MKSWVFNYRFDSRLRRWGQQTAPQRCGWYGLQQRSQTAYSFKDYRICFV